jgi:hypothetical protein
MIVTRSGRVILCSPAVSSTTIEMWVEAFASMGTGRGQHKVRHALRRKQLRQADKRAKRRGPWRPGKRVL